MYTLDCLTARPPTSIYKFDMKLLGETATRLINEVKGVNRVVYGRRGRLSGSRANGGRGDGSTFSDAKPLCASHADGERL
jgi:hypothetical protein